MAHLNKAGDMYTRLFYGGLNNLDKSDTFEHFHNMVLTEGEKIVAASDAAKEASKNGSVQVETAKVEATKDGRGVITDRKKQMLARLKNASNGKK